MGLLNTLSFIAMHPLSKGQRVASLFRFVAWQIGSRLVPGPIVVDFTNNTKLLVSRSMTGATGNIYVGLHEFEDMAFVLHFLRQGDLFADVGANVGSYTVLAASTGAAVVAFEPGDNAFRSLKRNLALNESAALVEAVNVAVGAHSGTVGFTSNMDTINHVVIEEKNADTNEAGLVPMTTLDNLLQGRCPALVKIDVEGFETEVLSGAASTLANPDLRCVIMELNGSGNRYGFDDNALKEKMIGLGFEAYRYAPFERSLIPRAASDTGANTVFVKDVPFVQRRLREANAFQVKGWTI